MPTNEGGLPASVILQYAAIAAVAFLLGTVVTRLCIILRKRQGQEDRRN